MRFSRKSIITVLVLTLLAAAVAYRINENADDVYYVDTGNLLSNIQHQEVALGQGERCEALSSGCATFDTKVVALQDDMPTVYNTLIDNIVAGGWRFTEEAVNERLTDRQAVLEELGQTYDEAEEVSGAFADREDATHYFAIAIINDTFRDRPRFLRTDEGRSLLITILRLDRGDDSGDNDFDSIVKTFPMAEDQAAVVMDYLAENPDATLLGVSLAD